VEEAIEREIAQIAEVGVSSEEMEKIKNASLASRTFEGEKLFVGLPAVNTVGVNILKRHGFRDGLTCCRMRWGIGGSDGDPRALFGITSAEKG